MIIVSIIFILFVLFSIRKNTKSLSNDISLSAFSVDNTTALRGILAISVVLSILSAAVFNKLAKFVFTKNIKT